MICGVSVVPAVVFSCIMLIPVLRIKNDLLKFVRSFIYFSSSHGGHVDCYEELTCLFDLPVIRFEDLRARRHRSIDETCFVCSVDYENEDVVSQLSRCKHVFHTSCLQKEMHRNYFSCPFCRNPVFKAAVNSPRKHSWVITRLRLRSNSIVHSKVCHHVKPFKRSNPWKKKG